MNNIFTTTKNKFNEFATNKSSNQRKAFQVKTDPQRIKRTFSILTYYVQSNIMCWYYAHKTSKKHLIKNILNFK